MGKHRNRRSGPSQYGPPGQSVKRIILTGLMVLGVGSGPPGRLPDYRWPDIIWNAVGAWRSLVARFNGVEEVVGSSPAAPTLKTLRHPAQRLLFVCPIHPMESK